MKYKHDEVIRAWLDGKTVQVLDGDDWKDCAPFNGLFYLPDFHVDWEYRIKPEPKPDVVRYVNVYKSCVGASSASKRDCIECADKGSLGIIKYTIDGETGKLKSAEVV